METIMDKWLGKENNWKTKEGAVQLILWETFDAWLLVFNEQDIRGIGLLILSD